MSEAVDSDANDEKPRKSRVLSSGKRDPKVARKYWTKENVQNAKPVPLPEPPDDVPVDKADSSDGPEGGRKSKSKEN